MSGLDEVAYHKTVNDALRNTLIPNAQNPELKALLQKGLTLFEDHQKHAEKLAGELH
jgi:putative membrane protein